MLETSFEIVEGHRVRYARCGAGSPIVLLHGYPETLQIFSALAPLIEDAHEVWAFDWPGMGASEPWSGGASPVQMSERAIRLMDHFGIDRACLLGTDMGGQPALVAAAMWPERVERLVVMNSLVFGDASTSWEIRVLRERGWNRFLIDKLAWAVFLRAERTFLPRGCRLPADLRADFWDHFRRTSVRAYISRMCAGYQGFLPKLPGYYERIRCPTLVLWGLRDKHFPPIQAERLQQAVGGATLDLVPDGHHWMMWNQAQHIAPRLLAFTNSPPRSEAG